MILRLLLIVLFQTIPLHFGDVVEGTITDEQPAITYRFTGSVNDIIVVEMRSVNRSLDNKLHTPVLILQDENGEILVDTTLQYTLDDAVLIARLPYTGIYQLVATRDQTLDYKAVGDYTLSLNRMAIMRAGDVVTADLSNADTLYYAYWITEEAALQLDYVHLAGDFYPQVTLNRLVVDRGGLRPVGMIDGDSITQGQVTITTQETFYILTIAQSPLDYVFDDVYASIRMMIGEANGDSSG